MRSALGGSPLWPFGAEDCISVERLCGAWVELICGACSSSLDRSDSCELELTERIGDLDIHTSVRCLATSIAGQPAKQMLCQKRFAKKWFSEKKVFPKTVCQETVSKNGFPKKRLSKKWLTKNG